MEPYFLSDASKKELDEIWDFYCETASDEEANRRIARLVDHFDKQVEFPQMGRARPEYAPGIRSYVADSYVIWYYIRPGQVEISRILHGSKNANRLLDQSSLIPQRRPPQVPVRRLLVGVGYPKKQPLRHRLTHNL